MLFVAPPAEFALPSRRSEEAAARSAFDRGLSVLVCGAAGSGRTSFATRLFPADARDARRQRMALRVTAAPELANVPFAALATLVAQAGNGAPPPSSPALLMAALARGGAEHPLRILVDDAEHLDRHSAAALGQLTTAGIVRLICVSSSLARLPAALASLAATAHRVELPPVTLEDAMAFLGEAFGTPVDASSANRLLSLARGNMLHLRELAFDAAASEAVSAHHGFAVLDHDWVPRGSRLGDLATLRLREQPPMVREAVELLAVTGPLPMARVAALVDREVLEHAHDSGLVEFTSAAGPGSGDAEVAVTTALSPELVLASFDDATLRQRTVRVRAAIPPADLDPHARVALTLHALRAGAVPDPADALGDVLDAVHTRQFAAAVRLSSHLMRLSPGILTAEESNALRLARAQALHETGNVEAALTTLAPMLESGDASARIRAAWVTFSARGESDTVLDLLAPRDGDPPEVGAERRMLARLAGRDGQVDALRADADDTSLPAPVRLRTLAQTLIERVYRGEPLEVARLIDDTLSGDLWEAASPTSRGELLQALYLADEFDGGPEAAFAPRYARLDWNDLALDHALFLAVTSARSLERGDAHTALASATQALALVDGADPFLVAPVAAVYGSAAAALLGHDDTASGLLRQFDAAPATAGHALRAELERATLPARRALAGVSVARDDLQRQLDDAHRLERAGTVMRLLHDGWRLGLLGDEALPALAASTRGVEGTLAGILAEYPQAMSRDGLADAGLAERLIQRHLAAERPLYAAELAARASDVASALGDGRGAAKLLSSSADIANELTEVNTPALGRCRIDRSRLTHREYEICVRAARGASNAEIAEGLCLSPRTVEGHLQRAYAKLGTGDRRRLIPVADEPPAVPREE